MAKAQAVTARRFSPKRTSTPRKLKSDAALRKLESHPRVEVVDDERSIGNSVIVTLKDGWRFNDHGEHVFGEDTPEEALQAVESRVKPCHCPDCSAARKMVVCS